MFDSIFGFVTDLVGGSLSPENSDKVAANANEIKSHASTIAGNAANISDNTANILFNTTQSATNKSSIDLNTTQIASNKSLIESNTAEVAGSINTNTTSIATNSQSIADIQQSLLSLQNKVDQNESCTRLTNGVKWCVKEDSTELPFETKTFSELTNNPLSVPSKFCLSVDSLIGNENGSVFTNSFVCVETEKTSLDGLMELKDMFSNNMRTLPVQTNQ
jgi:hypothetical protein